MNDNRSRMQIGALAMSIIVIGLILLFAGCASDCAWRNNGYCYHLEGL